MKEGEKEAALLLAQALFDALKRESGAASVVLYRPDGVTETFVDGNFDLPKVATDFVRAARERGLLSGQTQVQGLIQESCKPL